jgi:hypothetical protein
MRGLYPLAPGLALPGSLVVHGERPDSGPSPGALAERAVQRLLDRGALLLREAGDQRSDGRSGGCQRVP